MKATPEVIKRQMRLLFAILIFSVGHIALATAADTLVTHKKALVLVSVKFGGPGIDQYVAALNNELKKGGMKSTVAARPILPSGAR